MSIKANCGGLLLDNVTLADVDQIVTTKGSTPTGKIQANCGKFFDSGVFKMVDGVITDKDNMGEVTPLHVFCGGLVVDANCFDVVDGALVFDDISSACDITSFAIGDNVGVITGTNIAVEVPADTDVTDLEPTIAVSPKASVDPESGKSQDFTDPVEYVVTAQGGQTKTYKVTVTVAE